MTSNIEKLGFTEYKQLDIEELIALSVEQEEKKVNSKVVDKFTGEIKRFRSMNNPGNYHDATINTEESLTDISNYEPLETTIEKCSRSGYLSEYMKREKLSDIENAMDENPADFNFEPSPLDRPGFDISEAKDLELNIYKSLEEQQSSEASEMTTSETKSSEAKSSELNATVE